MLNAKHFGVMTGGTVMKRRLFCRSAIVASERVRFQAVFVQRAYLSDTNAAINQVPKKYVSLRAAELILSSVKSVNNEKLQKSNDSLKSMLTDVRIISPTKSSIKSTQTPAASPVTQQSEQNDALNKLNEQISAPEMQSDKNGVLSSAEKKSLKSISSILQNTVAASIPKNKTIKEILDKPKIAAVASNLRNNVPTEVPVEVLPRRINIRKPKVTDTPILSTILSTIIKSSENSTVLATTKPKAVNIPIEVNSVVRTDVRAEVPVTRVHTPKQKVMKITKTPTLSTVLATTDIPINVPINIPIDVPRIHIPKLKVKENIPTPSEIINSSEISEISAVLATNDVRTDVSTDVRTDVLTDIPRTNTRKPTLTKEKVKYVIKNKSKSPVILNSTLNVNNDLKYNSELLVRSKTVYKIDDTQVYKEVYNAMRREQTDYTEMNKADDAHTAALTVALTSSEKFNNFILNETDNLSTAHFSTIFSMAGKKNTKNSIDTSVMLKNNLVILSEKMSKYQFDEWTPRGVANVLYGFQCFREHLPGISTILNIMVGAMQAILKYVRIPNPQSRNLGPMMVGTQLFKFKNKESKNYLKMFTEYMSKSKYDFSSMEIRHSMYSLNGLNSDDIVVLKYIDGITQKLNSCRTIISPQEIGNCLYGLRGMSSEKEEIRRLIHAFTNHIETSVNSEIGIGIFSAQQLSNTIYGLQSLSSEYEEVKNLIKYYPNFILSCNENFSAQGVGNSLYGLKNMKCTEPLVINLIQKLIPRIKSCNEILNCQQITNSIYGMCGMRSYNQIVRDLIVVITPHLINSTEKFDSNSFASAIYGLQGMSANDTEIQNLINGLIAKFVKCDEKLSAYNIGNILYGLQSMDGDTDSVKEFLIILKNKINDCDDTMIIDSQCIANSIYGLKKMSSDSIEVRDLINALLLKFENYNGELNCEEIASILYGMRYLNTNCIETRKLLRFIIPKIKNCTQNFDSFQVTNSMYGMKNMDSDYTVTKELINVLLPKIKNCTDKCNAIYLFPAISSLRYLKNDNEQVKELIPILLDLINNCDLDKNELNEQSLHIAMRTLSSIGVNVQDTMALEVNIRKRELEAVETRKLVEIQKQAELETRKSPMEPVLPLSSNTEINAISESKM